MSGAVSDEPPPVRADRSFEPVIRFRPCAACRARTSIHLSSLTSSSRCATMRTKKPRWAWWVVSFDCTAEPRSSSITVDEELASRGPPRSASRESVAAAAAPSRGAWPRPGPRRNRSRAATVWARPREGARSRGERTGDRSMPGSAHSGGADAVRAGPAAGDAPAAAPGGSRPGPPPGCVIDQYRWTPPHRPREAAAPRLLEREGSGSGVDLGAGRGKGRQGKGAGPRWRNARRGPIAR